MSAITFPSGETIDFGEMSPEEMEPIIAQLQQEKPEMFAMPDSSQGVGEEAGTDSGTAAYRTSWRKHIHLCLRR